MNPTPRKRSYKRSSLYCEDKQHSSEINKNSASTINATIQKKGIAEVMHVKRKSVNERMDRTSMRNSKVRENF